jgi:iron-sulfur cluster repair protein YtfE (RIC family)
MAMTTILQEHHKHCDDLLADAEKLTVTGRWSECAEVCGHFSREMEAHFATEEQVLFPAFETATGSRAGPTRVMCMEHEQMRGLCAALGEAVAAQDTDDCAGAVETLLIMMQQHNMKEENILYPMCDQALQGQASLLLDNELAQRQHLSAP